MAFRGVILYRVQPFLFPGTDLNFRHLSSCGTIGQVKFSDIAILYNRLNNCSQENCKRFDEPLLFLGLFS